jgi:hypothetical protein
MFYLINVLTLDGEHPLLQFKGVTTIFDGNEVGPGLIHPKP